MKKNKIMRLASALLVLTLMTTCAISSTFAKYTTSQSGTDSARVAKWGFTDTASQIQLDNLFNNVYDTTVKANTDVIAPGTSGNATFGFTYGGDGAATAPEVAYTFKVDTTGSECAADIQNNPNIQWKLDGGNWGTWNAMITSIEALDGNKTEDKYEPNTLPDAFNTTGTNEHTVYWQWLFDDTVTPQPTNNDAGDTAMGNKSTLDNVTLKITVTATQVD